MPHGNDPNIAHQRTYSFFSRTARELEFPVTACLNLDPKTIDMRYDLLTIFDEEEAKWKSELLRFHQSQQQRNLNVRGYGLDERILRINRQSAQKSRKQAAYTEAFELEHWHNGIKVS